MKLFNFKQKLKSNSKDLSHDYYDTYFLPAKENALELENYFDELIKILLTADSNFSKIPSQIFINEITTIRFEIFALVWIRLFGNKLALENSIITEKYLTQKNRIDIWENAEQYNEAIADAATFGKSADHAIERGHIYTVNTVRLNLFKQFTDDGYDPKCSARVINRYFKEVPSKKGITLKLLTIVLCKRLSNELNKEAQQCLLSIIQGFYKSTFEDLSRFKITS